MPTKTVFIAQWDLIYHEMADCHRLDNEYTGCTDGEGEAFVHLQTSKKVTCRDETSISKMPVIFAKYGNLLGSDAPRALNNFVSNGLKVSDMICLKYSEIGNTRYTTFRKNRLVEKTTALYTPINRENLCNMASLHNKPTMSAKAAVKEAVQQSNNSVCGIEIVRAHGVSTEQLLTYDVCFSPLFYNKDGTATKPDQHELRTGLEMGLEKSDCEMGNVDVQIVDVIGVVRTHRTTKFKTFGDLATEFYRLTECYEVTHYAFDLYITTSAKSAEQELIMHNLWGIWAECLSS